MVEINIIYLLLPILKLIVVSDVVNGACQLASREYQMRQRSTFAFYPNPIQDNVLKDTIYLLRKSSSDVRCAVHCLQDESCKSFNYCNDNICQLKTANYSVKGSKVHLSAGCRHYGDEELQNTVSKAEPGAIPCPRNYNTKQLHTQVEEHLDLPMRLEFSVQGTESAWVDFSPTKDFERVTFSVGLFSTSFQILQLEDNTDWKILKSHYGTKISGEQFFVTYEKGYVKAGVRDLETSHMTYQLPSPPDADRMFLILENTESAEWSFFEPCAQFHLTYLS